MNVDSNFDENKIQDTTLSEFPGKEISYSIGKYKTTTIWAVDGWRSYTISFQSPETTHVHFGELVFRRIKNSFFVREQNGWQHVIPEPPIVTAQPYTLYLPTGWKEEEASLNVKFGFLRKEMEIKISLEILDEKTSETDPKKFIKEEDLTNCKEAKLGQKFRAIEITKIDEEKVRFELFSVAKGKMYHFIFKTKRIMMCVKAVIMWRTILDMFMLEKDEKDQRNIYINVFHGFGMKIPSTYHPLSATGCTCIKLWHQIRGHTHRVWCGTFAGETVDEKNMIHLWKENHVKEYKITSEERKIKSGKIDWNGNFL